MGNVTSLQRFVENIDGKLMLRIPLAAGGRELVECSRGISEIDGDFLNIVIPDWLAEKLGISEGTTLVVGNANDRFNIRRGDGDSDA
jgi:hypothetical protein